MRSEATNDGGTARVEPADSVQAITRRVVVIVLCFAMAALGRMPAAQAQEATDVEETKRSEAERLFRTGERAYHAGRYDMAVRSFEASYELLPAPQIAFSTAQALRLQYFVDKEPAQLQRAVELYRVYLEGLPQGDRREVAISHLAELEPIWLRLETAGMVEALARVERERSRRAILVISSPVEDAEASVAGRSGQLPFEVEVEPGRYEVTVTAEGYMPSKQSINAVGGAVQPVELILEPVPAKLSVTTTAGAEVIINGRQAGLVPLAAPLELAPGSYFVAVSKRGHRGWSEEIAVERNEEVVLEAELSRTRQRFASYIVFGFSGLMFLSSGVTALVARNRISKAQVLEERFERSGLSIAEYERYDQLRDQTNTFMGITLGLIGTGITVGATGFLLYWFDTPTTETGGFRRESNQPKIQPMFMPGGATMSLSGRF